MSQPIGLVVDGVTYNVAIEYGSMKRSFELTEGPNNGTAITGRAIRDILGTTYSYSMTVRALSNHQSDYDTLRSELAKPTYSHTIWVRYNQNLVSFIAKIENGDDSYAGYYGGEIWDEFSLDLTPIAPQRISTDSITTL